MSSQNHSQNALDQLTSHFESQEKKQIDCDIVSDPLFAVPATSEDYLEVESINKEANPRTKARRMAGYVSSHVITESGEPAFGKPSTALSKTLATKVSGSTLFEIFSQLFSDDTAEEVSEVEKKHGAPESDS